LAERLFAPLVCPCAPLPVVEATATEQVRGVGRPRGANERYHLRYQTGA